MGTSIQVNGPSSRESIGCLQRWGTSLKKVVGAGVAGSNEGVETGRWRGSVYQAEGTASANVQRPDGTWAVWRTANS